MESSTNPTPSIDEHPVSVSSSNSDSKRLNLSDGHPLVTNPSLCDFEKKSVTHSKVIRPVWVDDDEEGDRGCGWTTSSETDPGWKLQKWYGSQCPESQESVEEGEEVNSFDAMFPDPYADVFRDTP
ncbi:unnamed protein product [Cuscuta epithymum]|uniref:Uncharacterized protein n=1 Tax=Cuscuta epithymum TaxID=186058 RepID=A0AAV0E503_9ASTE|nr:unnamed protein product [Cuscuta epithymum]